MKIFVPLISVLIVSGFIYIFYSSNQDVEEIPIIPLTNTFPEGRILTVGSIAVEDVQDEVNDFLPFTEFIAGRLKERGVVGGQVKIARDIPEMATFLEQGEVDIFIDSPFPALTMVQLGVAEPMLRRWKKGVASYHTIFFACKSDEITTLDDLKGKIVAFDSPSSTSGYLLPKAMLLQLGYTLKEYKSVSQRVSDENIGYVFSGDDVNTMAWVLEGKTHVAAIDNHNFYKEAGERLEELEILARSPEIARHLVVKSHKLDEEIASAIKETLTLLDQDEAGKVMLFEFQKTVKFDEIPEDSLEKTLELMQIVESEL